MPDLDPRDLDERLRRLEAAVEALRRAVERREAGGEVPAGEPERARLLPWQSTATPVFNGDFWLSKVGMGLLLLGVAFLFKYSIEQGWLTELVRLGLGTALALFLTATGLRLLPTQKNLGRVLLGGGIATFYMVGFAASQLYGLLSDPAALVYMSGVTAFAYLLSLREEEPLLTIVGSLGGLGTPFLLYPRSGDLVLLSAYLASIAFWNGVVYARRRWETALGAAALGSWLALLSGLVVAERAGPVVGAERWALQGAVLAAWAVLGLLPAALPVRGEEDGGPELAYAALLVLSSPLLALGLTVALWRLEGAEWGWGAAAAGAGYLGAAALARAARPRMGAVLAVAGAVLLALGLGFAVGGDLRWVVLAALAAALHGLARRGFGRGVEGCGHALFLLLAAVFLMHGEGRTPLLALFDPTAGSRAPLGGEHALTDLALMAAALGTSFLLEGRARLLYRLGVHAAVLQWSWRELAGAEAGEAVVSAVWGVYGVALLAVATLRSMPTLQTVAKATLLFLVAKLFAVDLRALDAVWRILLFSGLGALFLLLSYYLGRRRGPAAAE